MHIRVLHFAAVREAAGTGEETLDLPEGATARDAAQALAARHAGIGPRLPSARMAVNQEFVDGAHVLREGDEFVIIPPVSGG